MTTLALYKEAEAIAHQLNLDNHDYFKKHNCYVGMIDGKLQLVSSDEDIKAMDWMFHFKAYYVDRVEPVMCEQMVVMRKTKDLSFNFEFLEGDFISPNKVVLLGATYESGQRYKNHKDQTFTVATFAVHMLPSYNKELFVIVLFDGKEMQQVIPLSSLQKAVQL